MQRKRHRTRSYAPLDATMKFDIICKYGIGRWLRGDDRK